MSTNYLVENNVIMGLAGPDAPTVSNPVIEALCGFHIDASNQFQGTLWAHKNGQIVDSGLGTASYEVRDKDRNLVAGLSESGLTADLNGIYRTTAVSASGILDLTHYTVKVSISVDGELIESRWPFTVGE